MNWKNIIKAPPPRPYKSGEKKIWESTKQPISTYVVPRILSDRVDEFTDKHGLIIDTKSSKFSVELFQSKFSPNQTTSIRLFRNI